MMFSPTGDAIAVSSGGSPVSLTFSGINRNNPVLRIDAGSGARVELAFSTGVQINAYSGERFIHVPETANSVNVTVFSEASGSPNVTASVAFGENV